MSRHFVEIRAGVCLLVMGAALAGRGQSAQQAGAAVPAGTAVALPSLTEASSLAAHGHLDPAMTLLEILRQKQPEPAGVERLRGEIFYQKEMLPEAEAAFAKAMAEDPSDREATEMRGVALYRMARPAEALPLLERANQAVGSANVDPQYVLGLCYMDVKRYDDARRAFAAQFGFPAESPAAYVATARLMLRREFTQEAAVFVHKALEMDPRLPLAHQLLGEIALAQANLPLAIEELEAEEKLNPLDGVLYERLGDAYVRAGKYQQAREVLNRAVLLEPNDTGPYILLGEALTRLGNPAQGVHYLAHAEQMDPGNAVIHTQLGQTYRAMGEMGMANREYRLAIEIGHRNDPKAPQEK